jgi:hypothetical protein
MLNTPLTKKKHMVIDKTVQLMCKMLFTWHFFQPTKMLIDDISLPIFIKGTKWFGSQVLLSP